MEVEAGVVGCASASPSVSWALSGEVGSKSSLGFVLFIGPRILQDFWLLSRPAFCSFKENRMSDWLEEGSKMPAFTLSDDQGKKVKSSSWSGSPLVIYFYPKDDTPGCTKEACAFRDASEKLKELGANVIGISGDSIESHAKFRDKFQLNFPLLADIDHAVSEKFGAYREKNMYGKKSMGIQRSTFLIDKKGIVSKVWKKVQVDGHDSQVLEAIQALA
jgi:peroxiredoxin Q/BCP